MGKSVRTGEDPFVLDDQDIRHVRKAPPKVAAQAATADPFVLGDDDQGLVKKKAGGSASVDTAGPGPSGSVSPSAEDVNKASKAFQDKTLTVKDQDMLAQTDWGKQAGLDMPPAWKNAFVQAHNGPKTSELLNSVITLLNTNYPKSPPGTPQNNTREQIFTSVQKGDIPAIDKVKKSIIDAKQQQILKIQNNPQGPLAPMSAGAVAGGGQDRPLSDQQKQQITELQRQINVSRETLDSFTAHAIVNKQENLLQLKVDLAPENSKYSGLSLAAETVGWELEKTVGIRKAIPNTTYERTRAGLEAIMTSLQMDVNDLVTAGTKTKNPALLQQAQEKTSQISLLQKRYTKLDNQFPDVGVYKTARYLGDILAETKPHRWITTTNDVNEAAAIAEHLNPGFLQSHGKFVDVVAKSEGDWIGIKSGLVPQGGVIGGVKAGTEEIGPGGAKFIASPFGHTFNPHALEVAESWLEEPQNKGTSSAGVQASKVVYDRESKAYREIPNEAYGKWDFNSAMYSLGKGVPTLAEWIVLDKGLGGAAKAFGGAGVKAFNVAGKQIAGVTNALIGAKEATAGYEAMTLSPTLAKTAGLYATTYITTFDDNHKLAETLIEDKTALGEAKKNALANILTLSTAGIFSMMDYSPSRAVESALAKNAAPDVMKFLEKSNWENLSEDGVAKMLKEQILSRAKAVVNAAGAGAKLGTAGVLDQKVKDFASVIVNPDKAQTSSLQDNLHSFADQVLLMTMVGLPGLVSSGQFPHSSKDALYQAGALAPQYIDRINERAAAGDLDQVTANNMIGIVKTMGEEVENAQHATNKEGLPLDTRQKRDLALSNFRKRAAEMLEEKKVPVGAEAVRGEADKDIDAIREKNSWRAIEESVPFQTTRDVDTGKKPGSPDEIDPDKLYTYEQNGGTVTATGAELSDHLIHGDYEQQQQAETQKTGAAKSKENTTPETEKSGPDAQGEPGQTAAVDPGLLAEGKEAIEKAIKEGKLTDVMAPLATANPEAFLKEIAEQARGVVASGAEATGFDAEFAAKDLYGPEIVDIAKQIYPREASAAAKPPIVARHGETEPNRKHKLSTDDTPLNATGEKQATALGEKFAAAGYHDVLPSDTVRAQQTAEKVIEQTGGKIIDDPVLGQKLKEWDQTGGESIDQFARRIAGAREEIAKLPEGTAVIAHGKVMGMLEALDLADGDTDKAKELFDKTKVYANTDTYIPSLKTKIDETRTKGSEKGNDRLHEKGNEGPDKGSHEGGPEGRKEGYGKSPAIREEGTQHRDVGETTQEPDGGEKERDVLTGKGAALPEDVAPSRKTAVNELLEDTTAFNKLRKNDPEKAAALNNIRLKAKELGLKVDYGKGYAVIKSATGERIQRRSEESNSTKAKDFDLTSYAPATKGIVNDLVKQDLPLMAVSIPGFDGKAMSEAQKENAIQAIRDGNITNGAKAVYEAIEGMVKEGFVELKDPATGQRVGVPLEQYLKEFQTELAPMTDQDITALNSLLGEDSFRKVFDDIFAETTQPSEREEQPAATTQPAEQSAARAAGPDTETTPGGPESSRPDEQPAAQPEAGPQNAEVPEEKVTGIRNVVVNSERLDRSLQAVVKEAATSFSDVWHTAKDFVSSGQADPRSLVSSLFGEKKPKVSDIDNAMILMDRIDLTNQRIALLDALEKSRADGDEISEEYLSKRVGDIEALIAQNDEVSDRTGQETARALSSRRMLATLDFTLSRMTAEIRRLYPDDEIPQSIHQRLAQIEKDHADLMRKYADREEEWRQQQAENAFAKAKEKTTAKGKGEKKEATEKKEPKPKTITLKGKDLADKIRSLRPKGGDTAQANLFALPVAVYDTAILTIANLVEGGARLADAITEAIKDIRFATEKDRSDFIDHINGFVDEETRKANTPEGKRGKIIAGILEDAREQNDTSLVKDNITSLRKIASSYIKEGVGSLNELVDKIHADLVGGLPDLTKREVRDAFSGYGDLKLETRNDLMRQVRDLQRQGELISQMEDVAKKQKPQQKGKSAEKPSKEVQRLKKDLEKSMKDNGITWDRPPRTRKEQTARTLETIKTRLKEQIDNLNKRLRNREVPPGHMQPQWDAETIALMQARDKATSRLNELNSNVKLSDDMRIRRLENSLKKEIADYEAKIREGGGPLREKSKALSAPHLEELRKERNALRELNRQMEVLNNPKSTPQEIALEAYKNRIRTKTETLNQRGAEGDFEPEEREALKKDAEALRLDLALKSTESRFYALKNQAEKQNRGRVQKVFDKINAYKRFAVLSSLPSLGKIMLAVHYRGIGTPIEELVGAGLRQIPGLSELAALAPREGRGFTISAERAALSEWAKARTYEDFLNVLRTGKGELDVRMGKYAIENPELLEFFGRVHASLKNFAKRSEYARAFEIRMDHARRQGFETTDEIVQLTVGMDAYADASRSIFMQDNRLTREYFKLLKRLEAGDSGWISKTAAFLARFTMPIVKVPTNFIVESGEYSFGALTGTSQLVYNAMVGGLTQLSPKEADAIMRSLKKGSIGLTLGIIGYMMPQLAGGYWQRGEQRDPDDPEAGEFMFFGQRIPKWATHFPALEAMQIGATLRRAYERRKEQQGQEPAAAVTGSILDAAGGLLGEVPLFEQPTQLMNRVKYGEFDRLGGDQFKSLNPQMIQNIAAWSDREDGEAVKRNPHNAWEAFETGIPGLRGKVDKK